MPKVDVQDASGPSPAHRCSHQAGLASAAHHGKEPVADHRGEAGHVALTVLGLDLDHGRLVVLDVVQRSLLAAGLSRGDDLHDLTA
jgi:hypothetical protein